jgi:hypothetical protein
MRCGILCHGFARARYAVCGHSFLVAFSCKGRGVCPSCTGRRMAQTAAFLADRPEAITALAQIVLDEIRQLLLVGAAASGHEGGQQPRTTALGPSPSCTASAPRSTATSISTPASPTASSRAFPRARSSRPPRSHPRHPSAAQARPVGRPRPQAEGVRAGRPGRHPPLAARVPRAFFRSGPTPRGLPR